jgi:hypothetical protein
MSGNRMNFCVVCGRAFCLVFIITFSSLGPNTKRSRSCIVVSLELAL